MRIENLSNHAGEILQGSEDQVRRALHDLSQAQSRHAEAQAELEAARKHKPWWKRMLAIPSPEEKEARGLLEAAKQQHLYADAVRRQSGHRVQQRAAGVQGEQELASWLSAELPDDWSGFGGYQNRKGEADLVLVGPPGVWVIEVKNRNVRLRVDGDRWLYDKLDKWATSSSRYARQPTTRNAAGVARPATLATLSCGGWSATTTRCRYGLRSCWCTRARPSAAFGMRASISSAPIPTSCSGR